MPALPLTSRYFGEVNYGLWVSVHSFCELRKIMIKGKNIGKMPDTIGSQGLFLIFQFKSSKMYYSWLQNDFQTW